MREFLIIAWFIGLAFFIGEFVMADSMPARAAKAKPNTFRVVDVIFGVVSIMTIYYIFTH